MKSTASALVLLAFSSLALAQCPEKKYDRFADKTTEICGGLYSTNKVESDGSSAETFSVTVYVEYRSQVRQRPLTIAVNIANIQLVRRGIARPHLDGQTVLYLLTDNKRGELRIGKYTPVPVEGALAEIIEVPLNADSLEGPHKCAPCRRAYRWERISIQGSRACSVAKIPSGIEAFLGVRTSVSQKQTVCRLTRRINKSLDASGGSV